LNYLVIFMLVISSFAFSLLIVSAQEVKYCCEKTNYGAWCQDAPENECNSDYRKTPTSCEATSFCKLGCCYDSSEGICMENTPQKVCQEGEGTWSEGKECDIPQCQLGCCVLGTQAAFVTLTRCKKLSGLYGLLTNFRRDIGDELSCISLAAMADEGACVYELDYIKTCKFTTRQECDTIKEGMQVGEEAEKEIEKGVVTSKVEFHKDFLCSAEELNTNCGPTKQTACMGGKDEVYFVDSCGNAANIYDASRVTDKVYWRKKISKAESCKAGSANINSAGCGNCDYFDGSICKDYKKINGNRPTYGRYICADLNCPASKTSDGKPHKHGESWCSTDKNEDSVGSRYFRHLCMNGEEIIEPCADFRQEVCIQDYIETAKGKFSQAACKVNRWQDCYSQNNKKDCENTDKRDCRWVGGDEDVGIKCVPLHSPGLKFWESGESEGLCSQANTQCVVGFEKKGLILGEDKKCVENCECLGEGWKLEQLRKCGQIGDCGAKINYAGQKGNKAGYKIKMEKAKKEGGGGGLLGLHLVLSRLGAGKVIGEETEENE
jgi:hypothetical protein